MGNANREACVGDDDLVLLTRASVVDAPHISPTNRGRGDVMISVDAYRVSPASDVVEYLLIRSGPDAHPTELQFGTEGGQPGYYEVGTGRLFINKPIRRSDVALYRVGDLRQVGLLR
ncbi:hypothetical protein [Limnoglobus roseus]|uniref:Uncharacterized protein n=1 Tax=Limnoglobus roseus TaxID=2598579 RepID=A0A5C1AN49_9BACT|nr:hypothetical protein [Limnoglobus roseus]QEL19543.1 hypothetical protein PX52LOC_06618 [Limnoglobus roseus]